jgi:S1-C subfamily serine protease
MLIKQCSGHSLHLARWIGVSIIVFLLSGCHPGLVQPIENSGALLTATLTPTSLTRATVTPTPPPYNEVALIDAAGLDFAEKRVIEVYKRVSPAVVNITTQVLRRSFFFEIIPEEGAGSGFVLDKQGHILTNFHVIEGARRIEVTFLDETTLAAQVVGIDPLTSKDQRDRMDRKLRPHRQ